MMIINRADLSRKRIVRAEQKQTNDLNDVARSVGAVLRFAAESSSCSLNWEESVPDLFSIALSSAASSAASWLTKSFLDAITSCPSCNSHTHRSISNGASTKLSCQSCTNTLDQYSIATPTTVRNGRLMGANIFNPHWEQHAEGWFVKRKPRSDSRC